ncbi:MAG: SGNH/GDSL hydrolase family protein [Cyanobacteria bacterium J06621_8]
MFKSKVKERRIFTDRKRVRRRFSWLGAIASVTLLLLVLELLTRIVIDLSGRRKQFAQTEVTENLETAYRLNFIDGKSLAPGEQQDQLQAKNSIAVGYELIPEQTSKYWQINPQGFREEAPVPLKKPQGEIRIFLLGGSTAFGYGNSGNDSTISHHLEQRLQQRLRQQQSSPQLYQPDILPADQTKQAAYLAKPAKIKSGNYRVINAAVPGYASGNELAQVALQILKYQPDLIVILNGYPDLLLPSTHKAMATPVGNRAGEEQNQIISYLQELVTPLKNNSYLAKVAQNHWLSQAEPAFKTQFLLDESTSRLVRHLPADELELQQRVTRYIEHQKQILSLSAPASVPLLIAIQPEITGRNPSQLTDSEGAIATELGRTYIQQVRDSYPLFTQAVFKLAQTYPQNVKAVDLYRLTDKYPLPSFIDAIHLNEAANQKVAEQLYYSVASFSKMQVTPKKPAPVEKTNSAKDKLSN